MSHTVERPKSIAVKVTFLAGLGLSLCAVFYTSAQFLRGKEAFDLEVYRDAVVAWRAGLPVYDLHYTSVGLLFTYPPFALLALGWTSLVNAVAAFTAMTALSVSGLLIVVKKLGPQSSWMAVALLGATIWLEPVRSTLGFGQVNVVLLAVVVVDVFFVPPTWRGVLVGLALAVKLTPGIFILYFILTRQRRALVLMVLSAASSSLFAFAVLPSDSWHYWTQLVLQNRAGPTFYAGNQSLSGMVARILGDSAASGAVTVFLAVGVVATSILAAVRIRRDDCLGRFGIVGLMGLLISPISWTHHWVWAIPITIWAINPARTSVTRIVGAALVLTMLIGPQWLLPHGHDRELMWGPVALIVGDLYVLVALALIVVIAVRGDREVRLESSEDIAPTRQTFSESLYAPREGPNGGSGSVPRPSNDFTGQTVGDLPCAGDSADRVAVRIGRAALMQRQSSIVSAAGSATLGVAK